MSPKILILIGILIFTGTVIRFAIQIEKVTQPEISIESKEEKPEITAWGFATVIKTPKELILFDTGGNSEILLSNIEKLGINLS